MDKAQKIVEETKISGDINQVKQLTEKERLAEEAKQKKLAEKAEKERLAEEAKQKKIAEKAEKDRLAEEAK